MVLRWRASRAGAPLKRLPEVVKALNNETTRLIDKKPIDAIREKSVERKLKYKRPVGYEEKKLYSGDKVRFLYEPGELEGGQRRATNPNWSLKVYNIGGLIVKENQPVMYYLKDGPKRSFVREELMVVPDGTELLP